MTARYCTDCFWYAYFGSGDYCGLYDCSLRSRLPCELFAITKEDAVVSDGDAAAVIHTAVVWVEVHSRCEDFDDFGLAINNLTSAVRRWKESRKRLGVTTGRG